METLELFLALRVSLALGALRALELLEPLELLFLAAHRCVVADYCLLQLIVADFN